LNGAGGGGGGGLVGGIILFGNSTDRLPKKEQLIKVSLQKLSLKSYFPVKAFGDNKKAAAF
jgi:hypothetical protein